MDTSETALARFATEIAIPTDADAAYGALQALTEAVVGVKLFTVMTVDMAAGLARRAYTSDPRSYPATGTKPIQRNDWFDIVHIERRPFVANTIEDIAKVFPDYELIDSLGCQSVVNLPVILGGELAATVNMLHETDHYTPERVAAIVRHLTIPAQLCVSVARG
ncbi:GAF domain-containing protein [Martelella soudanensis]|uniref:GAF domain-containing protein n=1 Tax=unclassified Martelella TaxID=2629616 RepID=UPI0015DE57EA|nr:MULTISPECIES: GAF domain-containing protein [unclassified Martelella]